MNKHHSAPSESTLYVSDLPRDLNKREFADLILPKYPTVLLSFKKARNSFRAIIQATNSKEAKLIKEELNFYLLNGKEIRIMYYNPHLIYCPEINLFVKNLPHNYLSKDLYSLFSKYGEIFSCKVSKDKNNKSLRFGFVCYYESKSAKEAILKLNETEINGKIVKVCLHQRKKPKASIPKNNLYVKNIPPSFSTLENFNKLFSPFGVIKSSIVKESILLEKNHESKVGYFGFVCFENSKDAENAQRSLNGYDLEGFKLFVTFQKEKEERFIENKNLLIKRKTELSLKTVYARCLTGNIELTKEEIKDMFSQFGEIQSISIKTYMSMEGGIPIIKNSPIMLIGFKTEEAAIKAVLEYKGDFKLNIVHQKDYYQKRNLRQKIRYNSYVKAFQNQLNSLIGMNRYNYLTCMDQYVPSLREDSRISSNLLSFHEQPKPSFRNSSKNPRINKNHNMRNTYCIPFNSSQPKSEVNRDSQEYLGEFFYSKLEGLCDDSIKGKVTGMLLELDELEQKEIAQNESVFKQLVSEALNLISSNSH